MGLFDDVVLPEEVLRAPRFDHPDDLRAWERALVGALTPHAQRLTGYHDYFRTRALEWQVLRSLLPATFDLASPHELIVELGAGLGFKSALLSPFARRLVAIDIPVAYEGYLPGHEGSPVAAARHLVNERLGITHVELTEAWPHELPVEDASVDVLYSEYTLEHVPDIERTAREAARVVRAGGTMVHVVPTMLDAVEVLLRANIDVPFKDMARSVARRLLRRRSIGYRISMNGTVVPAWHSEFLDTYRDQFDVYRMERVVFPFLEAGFDLVQLTQTREHNRVLVLQRAEAVAST